MMEVRIALVMLQSVVGDGVMFAGEGVGLLERKQQSSSSESGGFSALGFAALRHLLAMVNSDIKSEVISPILSIQHHIKDRAWATIHTRNYQDISADTMKFLFNLLLVALFAVFAMAATTEQKPVIVSYPKGTPDSVIEEAMEAVRKAVCLMRKHNPAGRC